jgi:hypothetical protein
MSVKWFDQQGLVSLIDKYEGYNIEEPAVYDKYVR